MICQAFIHIYELFLIQPNIIEDIGHGQQHQVRTKLDLSLGR